MPWIPRSGANRLYVEMKFTVRKCTNFPDPAQLQQCKETFRLNYLASDADTATTTSPAWNEVAYAPVDVIAANRVFTDVNNATINTETRSIALNASTGVYFAFHDQGSCMTLLAVRVYYEMCAGVAVGLASFPNVSAGADTTSVVPVEGTCVAHAAMGQTPSYLCTAAGTWFLNAGGCLCMPGYHPVVDVTGRPVSCAGQ